MSEGTRMAAELFSLKALEGKKLATVILCHPQMVAQCLHKTNRASPDELIDFGLEELGDGTGENGEPVLIIRVAFTDFGNMQKALEEKGITPISSELEWIPLNTIAVSEEQSEDVFKLIERLEQDDDVQHVFHNMA